MIVTAFNPDTTDLEKTYLSSQKAKGSTVLPVKNNDRFVSGRRILVGKMSNERSELATLSAVAVDKLSLTVGATLFDHNADDPIYMLQWDQIRFYRANSQTGSYVLMTTVDIDVDNAKGETRWDDTTSLSSHFYKTTFYNSISAVESPFSDAIQASGYAILAIGKVIDGVARRVRDTGYNILTPGEYLDIADEVGADLITQAHKPYRFLRRSQTLNTVAGQNWISLPANIWKYDYISLQVSSGNVVRYRKRTPLELENWLNRYDNNVNANQDGILDVAIDEETSRLYIYPTPKTTQTAVAKLHYYKSFDPFISLGQLLETPNSLIYRYKMLSEYYSAKAETDNQWLQLATKYENKYGNEIMKMQRVNRLDTGSPRSLVPQGYRRRRMYHL